MSINDFNSLIITLIGVIISLYVLYLVVNSQSNMFTIQDVYKYCYEHKNETITPSGDNCTIVINDIYGGRYYNDGD